MYRIGIPACWKISKTILIYKKGSTDLPSNFRPITLLPTMYKIYSGILSSRIIKVAVSNEWISSQQKGFLPGLKGIQEHTFLLESAITEAKKRHDDLHIVWLDLANAFGSLPHSTLNKLFESLPLPAHTSTILKDMYTNTICE